ncbi:hypothetical protein N4G70_13380 [Streptomyces sp. ASQP_92]|uniref:hypothetical protein n=1 Tax=Streptomyces sp. ASQP_92 TaxID=2979116 RepID=UPI0021BF09A3|nr:hypothetical protein [Streptomyces sp. ASQP_92]MCT9089854.1 hypothetical protein [Streptomyces sp. ASQP_92]
MSDKSQQHVKWDEFARDRWGRRPGRFTVPAPASAERVHELVVKAAEPFRVGTVYGALPKVRLHTSRGWLGAPGRLLPGANDADPERYLARAERELGFPGLLLSVHRPLHLDYALWAAVRDALTGLWRTVGHPCLPVEAELTEARRFTWDRGMSAPSEHAVLIWVLEGTLEATLWPGTGGQPVELAACAGELLYWPDGYRSRERHAERCVTLRVHVPRAPRLAMAAVRTLLADAVHDRLGHDGSVPLLPFPAPTASDGMAPVAQALADVGEAAGAAMKDEHLARALRVRWAALRSSAGVDPAPPPRPTAPPAPGCRIKVVREIIRIPDGPHRWIWAAEGHAFPVGGSAGARIAEQLVPGRDLTVAQLCRTVGADENNTAVLSLVAKLAGLRAIELLDEEAGL